MPLVSRERMVRMTVSSRRAGLFPAMRIRVTCGVQRTLDQLDSEIWANR